METSIDEAISNAVFIVDEPDGYVEDSSDIGIDDYAYDAYGIGFL